ncbi:ATP-binding protein [Brevibacillus fluminis]
MKIKWKIMLLSIGIVLFSLVIGGIIQLGSMIRLQEAQIGQRLATTARTVAEIPLISEKLTQPNGWADIAPVARKIRVINDVTYIVVMDMNRIRYSDPLESRIGQPYTGKDAEPAFAEHNYQQKVRGELGTALRAYVPVMNSEHQQVGVVMVGRLLPSIPQMIVAQKESMLVTFLLSLVAGIVGSYQLARHIKKQMLNLEPDEIARILVERTATFHAMHEGVIAIDIQERITIFNDKAKEIFAIPLEEEVLGRPIREVIPETRLPEVLEKARPFLNYELRVGNALLWSNRFLIKVEGKTVGALAIFQDRTEVAQIAEELTGVKAFVDALRVQNHEHMNKLHTIAGLLQLGQLDRALTYLFEISEQQAEITGFLTSQIADPNVSGLLLGKVSRGKELGIHVTIDRRSRLERLPYFLDNHDIVLIIGNLIENAFDALEKTDKGDKEVYVSIEQDDEICSILVEDNGIGMDEETRHRVLERGYSTKQQEHQGIGLFMISQLVEKGGGTLTIESQPGAGSSFLLTFPMKKEDAQ